MLSIIGIIALLIFCKFIYDTYITNNTDRKWNEYKISNPEDAKQIEKNEGLDFSIPKKLVSDKLKNTKDYMSFSGESYLEDDDIDLYKKGLSPDWLSILTASAFENASFQMKKSFVLALMINADLKNITQQSKTARLISVISKMLRQNPAEILKDLAQIENISSELRLMNESQKLCLIYALNLLLHANEGTHDATTYLFLSMINIEQEEYYSAIRDFKAI